MPLVLLSMTSDSVYFSLLHKVGVVPEVADSSIGQVNTEESDCGGIYEDHCIELEL